MKVGELGEFPLIDLINSTIGKPSHSGLTIGIGDDAAVWQAEESLQIATTDILVQDVHFRLSTTRWYDLGWKGLAINLSDIAAMGGTPCYALVSLALPPDTEVDSVVEFYQGLMEAARSYGVDVVGGNVSSASIVVVNISLNGQTSGRVLTRSTAEAGEVVAVTGYLGQSAAGLEMLRSGLDFDEATRTFLREAHWHPKPRVKEGRLLAECGVKTATDLSDGLLSDLGHICEASGVAAEVWIERLPVHPFVMAAFPDKALAMALSGGEDYELLFCAGRDLIDDLRNSLPVPISVVGEIVSGIPHKVTLKDDQGRSIEYEKGGWQHFGTPDWKAFPGNSQ